MIPPDDDDRVIDLDVTDHLDGLRVDRAVALLGDLSRRQAQSVIEAGDVAIDGVVVTKGSTALVVGQRLTARLPEVDTGEVAPDASVEVPVVYVDEDLVVVDKPAGLVVHPGAGQREGTMVAGLLAAFPDLADLARAGLCPPERPGIVHRLDKGTSGLLVVARTPRALGSLSGQLAERTMRRTYLGLVEGVVREERGVVDAPIARSLREPTLMAVRPDGRVARTAYRVVERIGTRSLLELRLETGRTHQIRVHLASIGHPVVNDTRYGHRREARLAPERLFLHAVGLTLRHPSTGDEREFTSELPADLVGLMNAE